METPRQWIIKSLYGWENNIYLHGKNRTLDALEGNKPVTFQIIEPTKYGGHVRAVVDNLPVQLTKKQIRWSEMPYYLQPSNSFQPRRYAQGSHNITVTE